MVTPVDFIGRNLLPHLSCYNMCPVIRGDVDFDAMGRIRHSVSLRMMLNEALQAEKTNNCVCIYPMRRELGSLQDRGVQGGFPPTLVCLFLRGAKFKMQQLVLHFRRMPQTAEPLEILPTWLALGLRHVYLTKASGALGASHAPGPVSINAIHVMNQDVV